MGPQGTLDWPLRRALQLRADAPAIVDGQRRFSYADLARRTAGLSSGLRSLGLSSGDRVAALAYNSFRHLELWMGVPPANLVVNDLNFRLAVPELEFILNDSGARALVTDRAHWEHADELRGRCPALEALVWADEGPAPGEAVHWDDVCAAEPLPVDHPELAAISGDTLAAISYTGGTTGRPKGVMQTHGNLVANAKHTLLQNPLHVTDRFLHSSPMFHAAGVANIYGLTWVAGTHVIAPGFEPAAFGRIVEDERVTVAVLVPTMLNMLLNHPGTAARDLSSWRLLIYAASPMPIGLLRRHSTPCRAISPRGTA